jgi:hypothetical protein
VGPDARRRVYAALPATSDGTAATTLSRARRLATRLQHHGVVGLSSFYADPAKLGCAAQEAELMLDVMRHADAAIADEVGSGTYKLLFRVLASHPEGLGLKVHRLIAPRLPR